MLIIFNPIIESQGNKKLTELKGWNDPDQLTQQYIQDIREASGNIVNYSVVERLEVDDINPLKDGFDYTDETYLQCLNDSSNCHIPWEADYLWILQTYNVCAKLNSNQIDELWMFGGPWFGYWEAVMAGPGAFNTNGPPISGTTCQRKLNIMGFNYERGVSEMLEDFVHRSEGTLSYVFGEDSRWGGGNYTTPWGKYALSDVTAPGKAACGWAHYAPNSQQSYDWSNQRIVSSSCEDWLNYPNLTGAFQQFNCTRWNCNGREFLKWWLKHLPKAPGFSDNKLNNWWRYIVDFNNI
ncbi:MAG: hypothetical protein Q8M94_06235 [Ignavibacteria bacterium]|nr:hypothetical protein [Ignavibacteria bacterium]